MTIIEGAPPQPYPEALDGLEVQGGPLDQYVPVRGLNLHIRRWYVAQAPSPTKPPFLLVHGLASNARTWDLLARRLNDAGHPVVAVDQRGHGLSDKPDTGYSFDEVTADLKVLVDHLGFDRPVIAGQSWGGAVVVDFAARYPDIPGLLVLVDGGFSDMQARENATWESISVDLKPPSFLGRPLSDLEDMLRKYHPDWTDEGIEVSLANFEVLEDGTIRPHLSLENHMQILRALWEQRSSGLHPKIACPVLLCPAGNGDPERLQRKRESVDQAVKVIPQAQVHWFENTAHDIHIHRPDALADLLLGKGLVMLSEAKLLEGGRPSVSAPPDSSVALRAFPSQAAYSE